MFTKNLRLSDDNPPLADLIFSLLFSFFLACYVEHGVFFDPTAINDDVRNQAYWMIRLIDPTFYPNDFIASYFTCPSLVSPAVKGLYSIAAHFMCPIRFSQLLPFGLVLISTLFLFKTTEAYKGSRYALWISFIFNVYVWMMKIFAGGISRSFFYPLLFLFLWLLATKRWRLIILSLCLQALIYPTAFFLSAGVLIIELLLNKKNNKPNRTQVFCIVLSIISGFLILISRYVVVTPNNFGPLITREEALHMPEFYADGRVKVFPLAYKIAQSGITLSDLFNSQDELFTKKTVAYIAIIGLIFLFMPTVIVYKKFFEPRYGSIPIPRYIWSLAGVSIVLCILAFTFLFYLYLPNKYIFYTLPLVIVFLTGTAFYKLETIYSQKRYLVWIFALFILIIASPLWKDNLIQTSANERAIYDYFKNLPNDILIAAPLKFSDNIPVFSYKSVLVSNEANIPFHKKYYKEIKSRIRDWDSAYFSSDLIQIKDFVKKYNIDYLVIDRKDFQGKNSTSILSYIPKACKVCQFGRYTIISGKKVYPENCFN